jgi:hypothetical protein
MKRWMAWIDRHGYLQHIGLFVVIVVVLQFASVPFYYVLAILPGCKDLAAFFGNLGPIS